MYTVNYPDSLVSSSFGTTARKTEWWENVVNSYYFLEILLLF